MVPVSPKPRPALPPVEDACPLELNDMPTEATDEAEMPVPSNPQTFFLGGLFALSVLAATYVASSIIVPVVCSPSC
jgi:hypothetical protein